MEIERNSKMEPELRKEIERINEFAMQRVRDKTAIGSSDIARIEEQRLEQVADATARIRHDFYYIANQLLKGMPYELKNSPNPPESSETYLEYLLVKLAKYLREYRDAVKPRPVAALVDLLEVETLVELLEEDPQPKDWDLLI